MTTSHTFQYVQCDIPRGMTLTEYRALRHPRRRRRRLRRLWRARKAGKPA